MTGRTLRPPASEPHVLRAVPLLLFAEAVAQALSGAVDAIPGWRRNFACDREQELLLPPSLRAWLPQDHLAWSMLEAMDLRAFVAGYHDDGWGHAAHDPAMTVALLVSAGLGVAENRENGLG